MLSASIFVLIPIILETSITMFLKDWNIEFEIFVLVPLVFAVIFMSSLVEILESVLIIFPLAIKLIFSFAKREPCTFVILFDTILKELSADIFAS